MNATDLQGSHLAIIGNSGSGKSYAIRRLLEDSWGQAVHIVFDVEDEFHSLRQAHPYVLVNGEHADIRVEVSGAGALARRVLASQTSVIIQLNSFAVTRRQEFIAAFLDALLALPRPDWRRALIVIDEADKYVPQGARTPSSQSIINLMAMGRKRGFVGVLATQRAAKISKSAVAEAANWMVGRQIGMNDRRVAAEQMGFKPTDAEMAALPSLRAGMFWRTGPAFGERVLAQVPQTATRHLSFGDTFAPPALGGDFALSLREPERRPYVPAPKPKPDHAGQFLVWSIIAAVGLLAVAHLYGQSLLPA